MTKQTRILFISDSLGTPTHPRGIFNYSVSLIEVLKLLGLDVTLMVEGADGYGLNISRARRLSRESKTAIEVIRFAEVLRYFLDVRFIRWLNLDNEYGKTKYIGPFIATVARAIVGLKRQLFEAVLKRTQINVRNHHDLIDFIPLQLSHFKLLDGLVVGPRFYSDSMYAGANGFNAVKVDATGYDLVVVDTPHFVKVEGISSNRVVTVVHDLIPLQDPTMSADWRLLFVKKLEETIAMNGIMVFVSETTRETFYRYFEGRRSTPSHVIYPPIRKALSDAADLVDDRFESGKSWLLAKLQEPASVTRLDLSLPYFVTPTSDEPRKNIRNLVNAFDRLKGKANLLIVGEVARESYLKSGGATGDNNVYFTGYISDQDKNLLIRHALGVIFPSFAEGFGIPIVEGAVFGKPVICSDIKVFREITADYALYFDPYSAEDIYRSVNECLSYPSVREESAARLSRHVRERFSQSEMAKRIGILLEKADIRSL